MKKVLFLLLLAWVVPNPAQEALRPDPVPFLGEYRLANGDWLTVTRMGVIDELAQPLFIDWPSGRYGQLMAAGSGRFVSPPSATPWRPIARCAARCWSPTADWTSPFRSRRAPAHQ